MIEDDKFFDQKNYRGIPVMKTVLTTVLLLTSSMAFAECSRPTAPELPNGATADMQTMVAGQKAVKAYVAGTEAYLDCLIAKEEEAGGEADPDGELTRIGKHNKAVDEMDAVAAQFNEEIREYKDKPKAE
jgi:hypothetical protein